MTELDRGPPPRPPISWPIAASAAAIVVLGHVLVNAVTPYGVHRDELLYMAMGEHLRLFRMDFPPFIAMIAVAERALLGDSLVAIRFVPAITAGGIVLLAAMIARELGGGRIAQGLAVIAAAASPVSMRPGALFQPVVLDQLWWTLALWALLRLRRTQGPRWWLAIGVIGGLGLLTKFSILILGFALLIAVLADDRQALRTRGPWLALAIALVIGSPSVIGQIRLGFPVVEQMRVLRRDQLAHVSYGSFLAFQLLLGPATLVALGGLIGLFRVRAWRTFRVAAYVCVVAFVTVLLANGKPYYVGAIYPTLYAAGGALLEIAGAATRMRALRAIVGASMLAFGAFAAPFGLPILPPPAMARYAAATGLTTAVRTNRGTTLPLPQDYADMLGWREQALAVQHVVDSLPPEKRAVTVIFADNYGEAGALDFYRREMGLPPVVSVTGSYWFFGPGERPGTVIVTLGIAGEDLKSFCGILTPAGRIRNAWGVEEEQDVPIFVCERTRETLQQIWPRLAGHN